MFHTFGDVKTAEELKLPTLLEATLSDIGLARLDALRTAKFHGRRDAQ